MLKTPLKIAALSVASLTLLSACGATDRAIARFIDRFSAEQLANNIGTVGRSSIRYVSNGDDSATIRSIKNAVLPEQDFGVAITIDLVPVLDVPADTLILNPVISSKSEGTYGVVATADSSDPDARFVADVFDLTAVGTADTFGLRAGATDTFVMTVSGTDYIVSYDEYGTSLEGEGGVRLNHSQVRYDYTDENKVATNFEALNGVLTGTPVWDTYGVYVSYSITPSSTLFDPNAGFEKGDRLDADNYNIVSGFATIGVLTTPAQMQDQNAKMTYSGGLELEYALAKVNNNDVDSFDKVFQYYNAQAHFDVDFDANTISGGATFYRYIEAREELIDVGNAIFGVANINSNGFVGNFILDREARALFFLTDNPVGQYAGNFFGPNAQSLAGVLSINGTTPNGLTIGAGGFSANKLTNPDSTILSTLPNQLTTQTATVTYTGLMGGGLYPTDSIDSIPVFYDGDLTMTVDFVADTIEGEGTFFSFDTSTGNAIPEGIATFARTTFDSNGDFEGDLSLDSDSRTFLGITDTQTGTYTGGFFGTEGDILEGALLLRGTTSSGSVVLDGGFSANTLTPADFVADRVVSDHTGGTASNNGTPDNFADDIDNTVDTEIQEAFSARTSGTTDIIMTVNGVDYNLTRNTDPDVEEQYTGDGGIFLDHFAKNVVDIRQVIDGTHATVQGTFVDYNTNSVVFDPNVAGDQTFDFTSGVALVGIQTPENVVTNQTATATYTGTYSFFTELPDGSGSGLGTSASMTVNFDTSMVSTTETLNGVTLDPAPIVGNGFVGTFTMDNAWLTSNNIMGNPIGIYAGNFFGSGADDIAHVMRINARNAEGSVTGTGGFRGDRDVVAGQ